jgi:hypothetical protein
MTNPAVTMPNVTGRPNAVQRAPSSCNHTDNGTVNNTAAAQPEKIGRFCGLYLLGLPPIATPEVRRRYQRR